VWIEEEPEDEGGEEEGPWVEDYPDGGAAYGRGKTKFDEIWEKRQVEGLPLHYPFKDLDEWEVARWLMKSKTLQEDKDSFLKLSAVSQYYTLYSFSNIPKVREKMDLDSKNKRAFFKHIDSLPKGPKWSCTPMRVTGDRKDKGGNLIVEVLELWHRNPVDVVKDLLGNPSFKGHQAYSPRRIY
jgi:hypothetical protein